MTDSHELDFTALRKGVASLERAIAQPKDEFHRDSVIQRFEYTFEMCWKMLKRYFYLNQQLDEPNVKNLFREAAKQGLIKNIDAWFGFHKARNVSSHSYNEDVAEEVYASAKLFLPEAKALLKKLESK